MLVTGVFSRDPWFEIFTEEDVEVHSNGNNLL